MKKTKKRALYIVAALLAALFVLSCLVGFAACGGDSGNEDACADGHTLVKTEANDATCTEAGNNAYWTCSVCNKVFSDETGTTETTVAAQTIAATGHTLEKIDAKEATCGVAGNKEYWTCSTCQKVFSDASGTSETTVASQTIAATGNHAWVAVSTTATCTAAGTTTYTCTVCDATETESTDALGHELVGTYVPTTDYTSYLDTSTEASWTYVCTRCNQNVTIEDTTPIVDVTLIATDETSLNSAVKWNETDAPLTVKLDSSTYVCSDCCIECDCEDCCDDCADCEGCCAEGCCTDCESCAECTDCCEDCCTECACEDCEWVPTITLQSSLVIGSDVTTVAAGDEDDTVKLTLDLNGNTLVYNGTGSGPRAVGNDTIYVKATGDVTIVDTSSDDSGVVDVTGMYSESLCNEGTVTLAGGLFTRSKEDGSDETTNGTDSCYTIENFGTMTIEEGTTVFNAGDYSTCIRSHAASATSEPATLTMNGGKVYGGKYAVGSGSSGYSDEFLMTGGVLGGLRSETDALPYRALNNYCDATITGGTLLGGNGGAITANPTKADECVEGVVIFNEDGDNNSLTIGDENGNGPEIIYEGINPNADENDTQETKISYYDGTETTTAFATGIAAYSGEVDINAGSISCSDTNAERNYTFMGVYLTNGTLNVSGGEISGDEALVINCASDEGASVAATITGGTLSGTIIAYAVTVDEQLTNPLTFTGYQSAGYTLTTETTGEGGDATVSRYVYTQGAATGTE